GVQDLLAQAELGGGDLDQLVGADPLDGLLQRQHGGRDQADGLVGGVGAEVGLLLLAGRVDVDVLGAGVLADHHALVHLGAGPDEQLAPLLELPEGVAGGGPDPVGDQGAVDPVVDRPRPVVVAVKQAGGEATGRNPISPLAGSRNSRRTQPVPWLTMSVIRPRRRARPWVTTPTNSSGTSRVTASYGSWTWPPTVRVMTSGRDTSSSWPSRRICSISTASWSSPRPCTSKVSGDSVGTTRMATLPSTSRSSRSLRCRLVREVAAL